MPADIQQVIIQEARSHGLDPTYALAVAERESDFDPNAKASKTIRGIFQMTGQLRDKYGQGDSTDPATQTRAFAAYSKDLKADMGRRLGREPSNNELYLAHHFGPSRAARMSSGQIAGNTPVDQVFTPTEMAVNPHFARAGTTGALTSGINADMDKRSARFGKLVGDQPPRPPADIPAAAGAAPLPGVAAGSAAPPPSAALPGVAPAPAANAPATAPPPQGLPGVAPGAAPDPIQSPPTPTQPPVPATTPQPAPPSELASLGTPAGPL